MSSGIGGGITGGVAAGREGGRGGSGGGNGTHRKNAKKFKGKNLNKLTKAPAAPPVPVTSSGSGGGSSSSFRGSSSSRNGLLLLSTKSKLGGSGLLAPLGAPKTAYDAMLLSAGAGGQGGGDAGKKAAPAPAWGMGEKKQPPPSPEKLVAERPEPGGGGGRNERPDLVLNRRTPLHQQRSPLQQQRSSLQYQRSPMQHHRPPYQQQRSPPQFQQQRSPPQQQRSTLQQQRPFRSRSSSTGEVAGKFEKVDLHEADSPKKSIPNRFSDNGTVNGETPAETPNNNSIATQAQEQEKAVIESAKELQERPATTAPTEIPPKMEKVKEKVKDEQVEYMSKLAKERAEKRRLEEEARMAAQKERAAVRLRELEAKRLEEKKKQLQIKSQERKEMSKPQVILEPLGKSKKDDFNSSPKPASKTQDAEKNGVRKLYDPDRPYSSLVGGKATKNVVESAKKQEERPRVNARKFPAAGPPAPRGKQSTGQSSADDNNKKTDDAPTAPVHMVQLSNLDVLDRGGRDTGQGGPRMLFDPTSGSMVAVPSREDNKSSSTKKMKQKGVQKSPARRPDDVGKTIARRPMDAGGANESSSDVKLLRGKQGKGSRKDDPTLLQKNKKLLDSKGRGPTGQHPIPRKNAPRTCGVLYKLDKSANYIIADGCEPDNGYGAHGVPGGKVKNPGAHAKLLRRHEDQENTPAEVASEPTDNSAPASGAGAEGFSFRNDPGFLQHQSNFEAQQQKILEDAWASLVENEDPMDEESVEEEQVEEEEVPASMSGDDDYAAALAISSSMIGLNFGSNDNMDPVMMPPPIKPVANPGVEEPIELAKFAMEAASSASAAKPANPFSPLGVSGAGLWGAGTPVASASPSLGNLGALTGWDATPFAADIDSAPAAGAGGINGSSPHASKLHLWGTGGIDALDDVGLGAFGNHNVDMRKGAD